MAFDALNRSLLVRFPDAAERIAERIKKGEVIDAFWLRHDKPISRDDKPRWEQLNKAAGGFAIELADAADYGNDFAKFQKRLADAKVAMSFDEQTGLATAAWTERPCTSCRCRGSVLFVAGTLRVPWRTAHGVCLLQECLVAVARAKLCPNSGYRAKMLAVSAGLG